MKSIYLCGELAGIEGYIPHLRREFSGFHWEIDLRQNFPLDAWKDELARLSKQPAPPAFVLHQIDPAKARSPDLWGTLFEIQASLNAVQISCLQFFTQRPETGVTDTLPVELEARLRHVIGRGQVALSDWLSQRNPDDRDFAVAHDYLRPYLRGALRHTEIFG